MIIVPDSPPPAGVDEVYKANVQKVFDGDGFLATVWHPLRKTWVQRVPFRFAFIDAPEMEQQCGPESRDFLSLLIAGKSLRLDPIFKQSTPDLPIDQYKRLLCMGYLTEQMGIGKVEYFRNGQCAAGSVKTARTVVRNVELEMIVNGWAWVVEQYSFEREAEYFQAQDDARLHRRGLWAMDNPEPPWNFKRRQKRRKLASEGQGSLL